MVTYFGISINNKQDGLKLTRENYIKVSNKSSFSKGVLYSEEFIDKQTIASLYNYDLNMKYYSSLSRDEFNKTLLNFLEKAIHFVEITDLGPLNGIPGYYVMVMDEYCQAYVGKSQDIKKRIQSHWSKQKEFDRLIYGSKENSILSIDSFRAYDTTRIFVYPTTGIEDQENTFINLFEQKYLLNRTKGGSLIGLSEANLYAKTREMVIQEQNEAQIEKIQKVNRMGRVAKKESERSLKNFLVRLFKS